ncbi:hypothetical protein Moror_9299 [Moniliophthora roreri MCA 2997]|uniref:Uncharacterized protein n=1 Tax=Moniliophthora roreri (strain MCA 2997) TaxID=1381753 RepID=V2X146_MONRO|nr:hypothetical protein Moror_9299 [Moniliophthora roreri MCA 2997]
MPTSSSSSTSSLPLDGIALAESCSSMAISSSTLTFVVITTLALLLNRLLAYVKIDRLDTLISGVHDVITDVRKKIPLRHASEDRFKNVIHQLEDRISKFKHRHYSIDRAPWRIYLCFFLWSRWKEPVAIQWAAGKIRREILAEAEAEKLAFNTYLELRSQTTLNSTA